MALCNLNNKNDEEKQRLSRIVNATMNRKLRDGIKFSLPEISREIYDLVKKNTDDHNRALDYAGLAGFYYIKLIELDPNFKVNARNLQRDYNYYTAIMLSDNTKDLEKIISVGDFLRPYIKKGPATWMSRVKLEAKTKLANSIPVQSVVFNEYRPTTLFATTWNERAEDLLDSEDPSMMFYKNFLVSLKQNFSLTSNYKGIGPLRITSMHGSQIEDRHRYPRHRSQDGVTNKFEKLYTDSIIQTITDEGGSILYFDQEYNITDSNSGNPIYFVLRTREDQVANGSSIPTEHFAKVQDDIAFIKERPAQNIIINEISDVRLGGPAYTKHTDAVSLRDVDIQNSKKIYFDDATKNPYVIVGDGTMVKLINKNIDESLAEPIAEIMYRIIQGDENTVRAKGFKISYYYSQLIHDILYNYFTVGEKGIVNFVEEIAVDGTAVTKLMIRGEEITGESKEEIKQKIIDKLLGFKMPFRSNYNDIIDIRNALSTDENGYLIIDRDKRVKYDDFILDYMNINVVTDDNNKVILFNPYIVYNSNNYKSSYELYDGEGVDPDGILIDEKDEVPATNIEDERADIEKIEKRREEAINQATIQNSHWSTPLITTDKYINKFNKTPTKITWWSRQEMIDDINSAKYDEELKATEESTLVQSTEDEILAEGTSTIVKPDVAELFESNTELANEVYEALGFNNLLPSKLSYKIGKIYNTQQKEIFAGIVNGEVYINKELIDKYSNKEILENQALQLNTILRNLGVYDKLIALPKEQFIKFLVAHEQAHLDFEKEGKTFKTEAIEEAYVNAKALIEIGILRLKTFDLSNRNEAAERLENYFPTKEEYIDAITELVAKEMDNATVSLSTMTGYKVNVFKGSLWGQKLKTSSMDDFYFLQGKDGYPKNKEELKKAISKDIARNIPQSIKVKYWTEILESLPDDEKALLSNWAYYNDYKRYTRQYGKPTFEFNEMPYPELYKKGEKKYTNWTAFIGGLFTSFDGPSNDLWFANPLLSDTEDSIINWYKNLTPEKLDKYISNLSKAMAFKSMVVASFEGRGNISALDLNARKVEDLQKAYYEIKQRTEISPTQIESKNNQITPQQKKEAQEKFQEYIDATGKQDIEGFKEYIQNELSTPKKKRSKVKGKGIINIKTKQDPRIQQLKLDFDNVEKITGKEVNLNKETNKRRKDC